MSDTNPEYWQKELRILLDKIQAHPSADLTGERQRIVILNKLIATRSEKADASA